MALLFSGLSEPRARPMSEENFPNKRRHYCKAKDMHFAIGALSAASHSSRQTGTATTGFSDKWVQEHLRVRTLFLAITIAVL